MVLRGLHRLLRCRRLGPAARGPRRRRRPGARATGGLLRPLLLLLVGGLGCSQPLLSCSVEERGDGPLALAALSELRLQMSKGGAVVRTTLVRRIPRCKPKKN